MEKITIVCYPKCSTCQKAIKWLEQKDIPYQSRDIKLDNPTCDELKVWHQKSGLDIKKFFNTSGLVYKNLELKDKLADMTLEEQLSLLATDGMLVKRPIILAESFVLTGFNADKWSEAFKK